MLRVGIIGIGFMGMIHYLSYQGRAGVEVGAICTRNPRRRTGDWRGIQGNFGPAGTQMDLNGVAAYALVDELLADSSIDLVDITLPPKLHADVAVRALAAGKHVFCEKPLALTVEDCQRMTAAARRSEKLLLVGHVLPFFPEYRWALEVAQSGQYGRLLGGSFKRVIADPAWLSNYWQADEVGGPMLDLHVHDAHFIRLLFGMPRAVQTWGRTRNALPEFWHSQFDYGVGGPTVHATSGVINQPGRSFQHGFEIHLEGATLTFEFAVLEGTPQCTCPLTLLPATGRVEHPTLVGAEPMEVFAAEIDAVIQSVATSQPAAALAAPLAQDALLLCHKQSESLSLGAATAF